MGIENIRIGSCALTYDGIDLGYTKGGVVVSVDTSAEQSNLLGYPAEYDYRITTSGVTVLCPLPEITASNISIAFPWTSGGKIEEGKGVSLRAYAKELIITPSNGNSGIVIPNAVAISQIELAYRNDEEQIMQITFRALTASDSDKTLMRFL